VLIVVAFQSACNRRSSGWVRILYAAPIRAAAGRVCSVARMRISSALQSALGMALAGSRASTNARRFDDYVDPAPSRHEGQLPRARSPLPELIADACRHAAAPLRRKLLEGLLRPVGSLALAAVASGAFSTSLLRRVTLEDVARITADQVATLARFVDQCNPDVLQQTRSMLA